MHDLPHPKEKNMTYYTIHDLVIGETGDPDHPALVGVGPSVIKTTQSEFNVAVAMMTTQNRRFGRQLQLREKGDLSNNPTLRNSNERNGGNDND
jgi:hypothetical protein